MPCDGCGERPKARMRFVGWKGDELIPTAPSGFKQGETRVLTMEHADLPYWEICEPAPELRVPDMSDEESVFDSLVSEFDEESDEEVYVPGEDEKQP